MISVIALLLKYQQIKNLLVLLSPKLSLNGANNGLHCDLHKHLVRGLKWEKLGFGRFTSLFDITIVDILP